MMMNNHHMLVFYIDLLFFFSFYQVFCKGDLGGGEVYHNPPQTPPPCLIRHKISTEQVQDPLNSTPLVTTIAVENILETPKRDV